MATRYSVADARAQLPAILLQAEAGETVELTRRGRPIAVIISRELFERLCQARPTFAESYAAFRQKYALSEVGLEDDFAGKVRDPSPGRRVKL